MEGYRDQIALLAHLFVVGNKILIYIVRQDLVPVHVPDQGIQLIRRVSYGVQTSYKATYAGA